MPKKVLLNSRTSGKFKRELIDGRSHIVTTMMPIRGDTTMNNKFYPDAEVASSFEQLNMLPAPHGHPAVNGISVSAFHPVANNKHNIGGWLRNSRKKGKRVFVDFMLDEEIANNSENGKEVIRRIEEGKKIGVSTGLTIASINNKQGEDDFGKAFNQEVGGYAFDHVAILLNEAAAGEHAGTELVLNEGGEEIEVALVEDTLALNEMSTSDIHEKLNGLVKTTFSEETFTWVLDLFTESKTFTFRAEEPRAPSKIFKQSYALDLHGEVQLLGDRIEGSISEEFVPKQSFNNSEVDDMDKNIIVLAIIGNSANKFTVADNTRLMAMSDDELTSIITTNTVDEEGAKELLTNAGFDFEAYAKFQANKAPFEAFLANEETRLKVLRDNIVANSSFTAEMVANKLESELVALNEMATTTKVTKRAPEGSDSHLQTNTVDENAVEVDYS